MGGFLLALVFGQCLGGGCATGPVAPLIRPAAPVVPMVKDVQSATIQLVVDPPDGEVWFNNHKVQSTGRERLLYTPPLEVGYEYSYDVKVCWQDEERRCVCKVVPGKTTRLILRLDDSECSSCVEADGVQNFGIDRSHLGQHHERITVNGQEVTIDEAKKLLKAGTLIDDSGKLRLTVIGTKEDCKKVLDDLNGPLADVAKDFLIQSYQPDHWAIARVGFFTQGKPTIYIQTADGKVLHRQDDYKDGADGLRRAITAIRKPSPDYDASKDRDLRHLNLDETTWLMVAAAAIVLLLVLRKG